MKYPSVGLGQIFRIGEEFYVVTEVGDEGVVLEDSKGDGREYSYEDLVREEAAIVNDIGEVKYLGVSEERYPKGTKVRMVNGLKGEIDSVTPSHYYVSTGEGQIAVERMKFLDQEPDIVEAFQFSADITDVF